MVKDERVVEMRFDNSDFERNAKTSMNTLDKLESKLEFKGSQKGAQMLESALNNLASIDMSGLGNALDTINYRFSTIGVIGQTIVSNLTSVITGKLVELGNSVKAIFDQIEEGGKRRATNFEQAKFMLGGLIDKAEGGAKRIQEILDGPVAAAVDGTRFGLDEAAVAASNLYASGITDDTELGKSLKAISGAAAMTNREYSDMAQIFATVKSNGKLMTMQLRQFSAMGMNVSAKLAKDLGKSEEQINQMVTDGKISYEQFADSMLSYFDQAKKANTTFSGALANTKAALSRIGEKTEAFKLERYRKVLTDVIPVLNEIKKQLTPLFIILNMFTQWWTHNVRLMLQSDQLLTVTAKLINAVWKAAKGLTSILQIISSAFEKSFDINILNTMVYMADRIKEMARGFKEFAKSAETQQNLGGIFRGIFAGISVGVAVFKAVIKAMSPVWNFLKNIANLAGRVLGAIGGELATLFNGITKFDLNRLFGNINKFFRGFIPTTNQVEAFGDKLVEKIHEIIPTFSIIKQKVSDLRTSFFEFFKMNTGMSFLDNVREKFIDFFGLDPDFSMLDTLREGFQSLSDVIQKLGEYLQKAWNFTKKILEGIRDFITNFFEVAKTVVSGFFGFIKDTLAKLEPVIGELGKCIQTYFGKHSIKGIFASLNLVAFLGAILDFLDTMGNIAKDVKNMTGLATSLKTFITDMNKQLTRLTDIETLKSFAVAIALLAGSIFVLSLVDPKRLAAATIAITFMIAQLEQVMDHMNRSGFFNQVKSVGDAKTSVFARMGGQFIVFAAAILILAGAVKKLASLSIGDLLKGFIAMSAVIGVLIGSMKIMDNLFKDPQAATKLVGISEAMLIMAVAVRIMASALKAFSKIDFEKGGKGLLLMAGTISEVVAALLVLEHFSKDSKALIASAGAIAIVAFALNSMATALALLSVMNQSKLATSLAIMAGALAAIVVSLRVLEEFTLSATDLLAAAGSIAIVATSLVAIGAALAVLSLADPESLLHAVEALGGMLLIVTGALYLLTNAGFDSGKMLAAAGAIAILSVSMIALSTALLMMSLIPGEDIGTTLMTLSGALMILLLAAKVAEAVLPGMLALAAGVAVVGAGFLMFSVGLSMMGSALETLAGVDYKKLGPGMLQVAAALLVITGPGLKALPAAIAIGAIAKAMVSLAATITMLKTVSGNDIDEAFNKIDQLMSFVSAFIDKLILMLYEKSTMFALVASATVLKVLQILGQFAGPIAEAGVDLFVNLLQGFADGVYNRADDIRNAIKTLIDALIAILVGKDNVDEFKQAAHDVIQGFIDGIAEKVSDAVNGIKAFGQSVIGGLKDILGIASPSKVARVLGMFTGEGYLLGIKDMTAQVKKAGEDLGNAVVSGIQETTGKGNVYREYVKNANKQVRKFVKANKLAQYNNLANKLYFKSDDYKKNVEDLKNYYREYNKQYKKTQEDYAKYKAGGKDAKSAKTSYENDLEKLKEIEKNMKSLAKTIAKGPQKALSNFRKEIKNTVKEYLKFSSLDWNKVFEGFEKMEKSSNLGNSQTIIEGLSGSLREVADAAKATSDQFDLLNTGSGTGINLLERFGKVGSMTARRLMTNAKSQLKAYEEFQNGIKQMYTMGFSTDLINTMKSQGPEALKYIRGFLKFSEQEVNEYNDLIDQQHEYEEQQLKENMEQKVSTYEEYMDMIEQLAAKGLSEGIVKRLKEAGVEQATFVRSLLRFSEGDIFRVNELYEKSVDAMNDMQDIQSETDKTYKSFNEMLQGQIIEKWAWGNMLSQLKSMGLDEKLIQTFKDMGSDSAKVYVEQILKETPEGIKAINENYAKLLDSEDSPAEVWLKNMKASRRTYNQYTENMAKMAEMLPDGENSALYKKVKEMGVEDGAEYAEAFVNAGQETQDRIVREFNKQQKINAEQLQDELVERIQKVKQWSDDLNKLADMKYTKGKNKGQRIISEELMDELVAMGPEAAEKIHALTEMSRTELRDYAVMYDEAMSNIPGKVTNSVTQSYAAMAGDGVKAFKEKVTSTESEEDLSKSTKKVIKKAADNAKPTAKKKGEELGKEALDGAKTYVSESKGKKIASNMAEGMSKGFEENTSIVKKAAKKLAKAAYDAMCEQLDSHSPSKKTEELGMYTAMGLGLGISRNEGLAIEPVIDLTDKLQEAFAGVVESVQNGTFVSMNVGMNFVPNTNLPIDLSSNVAQAQQIMDIFSSLSGINLELGRDANRDVVTAINDMRSDFQSQFDGLSQTISEMQLVMDSGALVGQIANPMNEALGERVALAQRGVLA